MIGNSPVEFNLKPTDLRDNGYIGEYARDQGEYYFSNFASRAKYNTSATSVEIKTYYNELLRPLQ